MILVSGVSRSGTSLMMACLVKSLGKDRVFGEQFPQHHTTHTSPLKQGPVDIAKSTEMGIVSLPSP